MDGVGVLMPEGVENATDAAGVAVVWGESLAIAGAAPNNKLR